MTQRLEYTRYVSRGAANAYLARLDSFLGYPNPETKTNTYAILEINEVNGDFLIPAKEGVFGPALGRDIRMDDINAASNGGEIGSRKSRATLEAEGAFDPDTSGYEELR